MKYVIVDDNLKMRRIIRQVVCSQEDEVFEYNDGKEAVDAYAKHLPDYVLMDIQMECMDGIAATQSILQKFPSARIIIVTDYDIQVFRLAAKKAGVIAFFSKENLDEVKEFINSISNKILKEET